MPEVIKDGTCPLCDEETNSLAGDPGQWALWFVTPEEQGVAKPHHARCVFERVYGQWREEYVVSPQGFEYHGVIHVPIGERWTGVEDGVLIETKVHSKESSE